MAVANMTPAYAKRLTNTSDAVIHRVRAQTGLSGRQKPCCTPDCASAQSLLRAHGTHRQRQRNANGEGQVPDRLRPAKTFRSCADIGCDRGRHKSPPICRAALRHNSLQRLHITATALSRSYRRADVLLIEERVEGGG